MEENEEIIEKLKDEDLPKEMKGMTVSERKEYIGKKAKERAYLTRVLLKISLRELKINAFIPDGLSFFISFKTTSPFETASKPYSENHLFALYSRR